jgi:hypothetical protein
LFEKKSEKKSLLRKKGFTLQKTGIANSKKDKNRIYLRKKGGHKKLKKEGFHP